MSLCARIGIALLAAIALTAAGVWLGRELSIDGCLDRGGSWDYDHSLCVMAEP